MTKITLLINTPSGSVLSKSIAGPQDLDEYPNPLLLAVHNAATGRGTKKFATRDKALTQTWKAIQEFAEIDARTLPPVLTRAGVATAIATPDPVPSDNPPASRGRGRPAAPKWKAQKQKDGSYLFNMPARAQKAEPGGRRPELIAQLRKRPTFAQLLQRFTVTGDTPEARAFNLATAVTCMCHVTGYGAVTQDDRRITLTEPLA